MALKTLRKSGKNQEEQGFYRGFFINEANHEQLTHYAVSTGNEDSELINRILSEFFLQKKG